MPVYAPNPDEIRERCLEVQEGWSEQTRISRMTGLPKRDRIDFWTPPVVSTSEYGAAIQDAGGYGDTFDLW